MLNKQNYKYSVLDEDDYVLFEGTEQQCDDVMYYFAPIANVIGRAEPIFIDGMEAQRQRTVG